MSTEQGRRWLAAGMGFGPGMGIIRVSPSTGGIQWHRLTENEPEPPGEGWVPNFSDDATMGVARGLLRKRWGIPDLHVTLDTGRGAIAWKVVDGQGRDIGGLRITRRTDADALIAAAEAAP